MTTTRPSVIAALKDALRLGQELSHTHNQHQMFGELIDALAALSPDSATQAGNGGADLIETAKVCASENRAANNQFTAEIIEQLVKDLTTPPPVSGDYVLVPRGWKIEDEGNGFVRITKPDGEWVSIGYFPPADKTAAVILRDLAIAMLSASPAPAGAPALDAATVELCAKIADDSDLYSIGGHMAAASRDYISGINACADHIANRIRALSPPGSSKDRAVPGEEMRRERVTQQEHSVLCAVDDWKAPYEVANILYPSVASMPQRKKVAEALRTLHADGLIDYGAPNNTYRINAKGRASIIPQAEGGSSNSSTKGR